MKVNTQNLYSHYLKYNTISQDKENSIFSDKISESKNYKDKDFSQSIENKEKILNFFRYEYKNFEKERNEHNRKILEEDKTYEPSNESKYFKEKRLYLENNILLDGDTIELNAIEYDKYRILADTNTISSNLKNNWLYQVTLSQSNENKYEDAPEFEAFVNKWIENGATEIQALERAMFYSQAGLLDYGNQRAITIDKLGFGDKKQHGMHLINNDALKNAMIETFDSLDNAGVGTLVERLFMPDSYLDSDDSSSEDLMFQNLIGKFTNELKNAGGLEKLNSDKYSNYKNMNFDGNINISDTMNQEEKNFIYDSLLEYFNNHISKLEQIEEKYNESWEVQKEAFNLLIKNLKNEIAIN